MLHKMFNAYFCSGLIFIAAPKFFFVIGAIQILCNEDDQQLTKNQTKD